MLREVGSTVLCACIGTFTDTSLIDLNPEVAFVIHSEGVDLIGGAETSDGQTHVLLIEIEFLLDSAETRGCLTLLLGIGSTNSLLDSLDPHLERLGLN